jgi:hypothetical protein
MSSTQKTAIFVYTNKTTEIPCQGKEKFVEVIKKYLDIINPNSNIVEYYFYYEGTKIESDNYEKPIEDNVFGKKESFILSVEKNIKIIKCPNCNYDDCVVSLLNYKTTFYNCEHFHLNISSYDHYLNDQVFFPERIICSDTSDTCLQNARNDPDFKMCLTCSQTVKRTRSICSNCIKKHKEQNHFIIKYEDKNYYCPTHIKRMEKYCFQCKVNLCVTCAEGHNGHLIKSIDSLIPLEKEIIELKNSLKTIKEHMDSLQIIINDLIYSLKGAMKIYTDYYNSANHIIDKYESFNKAPESFKNFTIFKCLYNLKLSNKQILEDILSVINEEDKADKAKYLIGIYSNKKKEYYANEKQGGDLNKEDDTDWLNEICEREKEREKERKTENDVKPTYHLQI